MTGRGGSQGTEGLQDETFDFICSLCTSKSKNTEAEKYCIDCQDYYCSTCISFHDDVPALSKHKILDKEQFQHSNNQKGSAILTERCGKHLHNHVDMYCEFHNEVGCPTCMATEHRSCQDIFYIPDFLEYNSDPSSSQETKEKLEAILIKLKEYQSFQEAKQDKVMKRKTELLQKIKTVRKSIDDRLNALEEVSVNETEELFGSILNMIQDELKKLQATKDLVLFATKNFASPNNNVLKDFVNVKKGEKLIKDIEKYFVSWNEPSISSADTDFVVDKKFQIKLGSMERLGHVNLENTAVMEELNDEAETEIKGKETQNIQSKSAKKDPKSLYQAKNMKKYNVKHEADHDIPTIINVCTLEDDTVLLADSKNKNLKHAEHSTFKVKDCIKLPGPPWQICVVDKKEVAVSCQELGVQFVGLQPKMTKTNHFQTDHSCLALAHADGNVYISDFTSVYIYTLSGQKLQQFYVGSNGGFFRNFCKSVLFSQITSLLVTDDSSEIYVTDIVSGLTVLDRNGKVSWQNKYAEMSSARSICRAENDKMFVLGSTSSSSVRKVLQLGPSREVIGEVLMTSEKKGKAQAICYNHLSSKLIVTFQQQNEIEVYDLN